ncbi:MAG: hypothetical protein FWH37_01070 [Candidatus Bathyarchaeota archaeon]|nr:hypothetical protein [Candidatus Termiticorpusculum sp.]
MCFYIEIEDLAANALIGILKENKTPFITYKNLEEYGAEVISHLRINNKEAVLILSRERTNAMLRNHSDTFKQQEDDKGNLGISLKEGVKVQDLVKKFCGYLAWDVLLAFVAVDKARSKTNVAT